MKTSFPIVAGLLTGLLVHGAARPAQADFVLGAFDSTRSSTANPVTGLFSSDAIAALNASFPGITYAAAPTLTPGFLAGVDVLILTPNDTDTLPITPLSAGEQTALFDFIQAGGRAFLIADGFSPFVVSAQSMVAPFGVTIVDDGLSGPLNATPTTHAHPVINGPFGDTSSIPMLGAGVFTNLGPHATSLATLDALGLPALAAIEAHTLGPNSGRVVLISDVSLFADDNLGGYFSQSQTLFLNAIDFLRVPEPGSRTLATLGAGGIGLVVALRSRRRPRGRSAGKFKYGNQSPGRIAT